VRASSGAPAVTTPRADAGRPTPGDTAEPEPAPETRTTT
jgi:hypothetical protein